MKLLFQLAALLLCGGTLGLLTWFVTSNPFLGILVFFGFSILWGREA